MQRWMEQKTKEQPLDSVESFAAASLTQLSRAGRDTGSNSAVAERAEQE